jgi:phosphate starvation-inducible PhoH-like protein
VTKKRTARKAAAEVAAEVRIGRPINDGQKAFNLLIERFDIVFLLGEAGSGKTWASANYAYHARRLGLMDRIVLTRPMIECGGERMGFLPGDVRDKFNPYLMPFKDVLDKIVGPKDAMKTLESCEAWPLAHIRGRSIGERTVAIFDEVQNATLPQLQAYLTRITTGGKMILCGDPEQSDIPGSKGLLDSLAREMEKDGLAGVVRFDASMIVRSPLIAGINQVFKRLRKLPGVPL